MYAFKHHIPLLHILTELNQMERAIILSHLDDTACKTIVACIKKVEKVVQKMPMHEYKEIKRAVGRDRKIIKNLTHGGKSFSKRKKKDLPRIAGSLPALLGVVLPILLDLIRGGGK